MNLSEAILLGSTVVKPQAGTQFDESTGTGCAIGMAGTAIGAEFRMVQNGRRDGGLSTIYGWEWTAAEVRLPCWCYRPFYKAPISWVITHIFDVHVMRRKNWTLDRLVAWVRKYEPVPDAQLTEGRDPIEPEQRADLVDEKL